jgi:hypothetical protein
MIVQHPELFAVLAEQALNGNTAAVAFLRASCEAAAKRLKPEQLVAWAKALCDLETNTKGS